MHKPGYAFIKYESEDAVDAGLDGVEGDDEGQKVDDHLPGRAHEIRGYEQIGGYHHKHPGHNAQDDGNCGAFFGLVAFINE